MPMRAEPSTFAASFVSLTRRTLGLEGGLDALHGGVQAAADQTVEALLNRHAENRGGWHVLDPQLDAHAFRDGRGREATLLLDEARLRDPADRVRAPPSVEPQHRSDGKAERRHLHLVARTDSLRPRPDGLPAVHALQHVGDVVIVGEVVESPLGAGGDLDWRGERELRQYSMKDMRSMDGRVWVEDSVDAPRPPPASRLRDRFMAATAALTLGLVQERDGALVAGPVQLLRFGEPETAGGEVVWPIVGGVLAREPGGRLRVSSSAGALIARVEGYRPSLPLPLYRVTQLPLHHALVRLVLLGLRGRRPAAGVPADVSRRLAAGAID